MITVEVELDESDEPKDVVSIYMDQEGLDEIISRLQLLRRDEGDHLHLMSESWGLGDLSESQIGKNSRVVHHLKLEHFGPRT